MNDYSSCVLMAGSQNGPYFFAAFLFRVSHDNSPVTSETLLLRDFCCVQAVARVMEAEKIRAVELALKRMEELGADCFKAQQTIVEDILTMKCPRCKNAFTDWTGCNALYCTYAGCGCGFCAFCFKDCGTDAHGCMNTHSAVAATPQAFWVIDRTKKIDALLEKLDRDVQRRVVNNLRNELKGHGLKPLVVKFAPSAAALGAAPAPAAVAAAATVVAPAQAAAAAPPPELPQGWQQKLHEGETEDPDCAFPLPFHCRTLIFYCLPLTFYCGSCRAAVLRRSAWPVALDIAREVSMVVSRRWLGLPRAWSDGRWWRRWRRQINAHAVVMQRPLCVCFLSLRPWLHNCWFYFL